MRAPTGGRSAALGLLFLFFVVARAAGAQAAEAPAGTAPPPPVPAPAGTAPPPPVPAPAAATPAETQAAAAQREAQEAEAQVIELRRQLEALERERASYDDVRRRLDQIDARQGEIDRRAAAARDANPPETSVIRFHDDGLSIRSPDNGFYLHPMVRVQAIYTGAIATQGTMDKAAPDVSSFSLGRAELILEGHVGGPFFQYRFQFDPAESPALKDAYLTWHPIRMLSVEAGQFKVPYGLQRQYWKAELEFVNISAPMAAFSLERDLGVMLVGRLLPGRLTVQAALLDGAGAGVPNDNVDLAYALRIVATPFGPLPVSEGDLEGHVHPLLSVGASGYYNLVPTDIVARSGGTISDVDVDGNGRVDNVGIWQAGFELRALWRGAALQAEWFGRREEPGPGAATSRGAISSCRTGCSWPRAWATPTCRSTGPPPSSGSWPAAGRTSRAAWCRPTCADTGSRCRPSTPTWPPTASRRPTSTRSRRPFKWDSSLGSS
jgi:hypothetical protein